MSRTSEIHDSVLNCSHWCQKTLQTIASFAFFSECMCVGCACMCDYKFCVGTHTQVHRHTCGHSCGSLRLMSCVSLSGSLAEPWIHQFGLASQLASGKLCVCLLRAVLTEWPPGPLPLMWVLRFQTVAMLEGYTLYPLCHLLSLF